MRRATAGSGTTGCGPCSRAWARRALGATLLALAAAPAFAGALHGSLSFGRSPGAARARDAVVWIEQVPEKTERKLTRPPTGWFRRKRPPAPLPAVVESNRRFRPRVTAIAAGGLLVIRNQDQVWHGPFSVSPARTFDLGKRAPGRADTLRFDSTGVVALRCDIHPDMSAFVIVTPNHAFTRPDAAGNWQLPELPAGHYVVRAWHPDKGTLQRAVDVPARGPVALALRW